MKLFVTLLQTRYDAGTLWSADEAARALQDGWRLRDVAHRVSLLALADSGGVMGAPRPSPVFLLF